MSNTIKRVLEGDISEMVLLIRGLSHDLGFWSNSKERSGLGQQSSLVYAGEPGARE